MSLREAFLQAIIAAPDDDTPRLVYADWLDETGEPADAARAFLIRFQIETARLPDDHPDKSDRIKQSVRLTEQHKDSWFGWVRHKTNLPYPQRGFLDRWFCGEDAEHKADLADAFRHEPITSATFHTHEDDLLTLATWPQLARLQTLNLWPGVPEEKDLLAFFSSPHISGLQKLWYMGTRGTRAPLAESVRCLATQPQYAGLRSLTIEAAGVGDVGATVLAASNVLARLTTLVLSHCDIGSAGCQELLTSPVVAGLTNLNLGGNARTAVEGETLAELLADSPHLSKLEVLTLDQTAVTNQAASQLARANWPALKSLTLLPQQLHCTDETTGLPTLTTAGLESITQAPWSASLEVLDLSGQPLGDTGAGVLAAARLPRLHDLTLMTTSLTAAGLRELIAAYASQLDHLQLAHNPLGDAGAELVASATWPRMVPRAGKLDCELGLFVAACEIGDQGARALLDSKTITADVPELFIGPSPASAESIAALKAKYTRATVRF